MSVEYYTGIAFDKAKEHLMAANTGVFSFDDPMRSRYVPECRAFLLRHIDSGNALWCLNEVRTGLWLGGTVLPPIGTLTLERMLGNNPRHFMPWIEKTLGVRIMNEVGLPWELDL